MVLKLNSIIIPVICLSLFPADIKAQDPPGADTTIYYNDDNTAPVSEEYPDEESYYMEGYHFHDSDQYAYNNRILPPKFEPGYWKDAKKNMNFEEDSQVVKKDEKDKPDKNPSESDSRFSLPDFKGLFIILAIAILGIVIYYLVKNTNIRNKKTNTNILINFDDLDEETLRQTEFNTPLEKALKAGDYRTAYRIRYLTVLQQLIARNMIVYRKEKTNYDYLLQLSGQSVYDPFRSLTFNFDGIWYGDLFIDEARYTSLLPHFNSFETIMSKA